MTTKPPEHGARFWLARGKGRHVWCVVLSESAVKVEADGFPRVRNFRHWCSYIKPSLLEALGIDLRPGQVLQLELTARIVEEGSDAD